MPPAEVLGPIVSILMIFGIPMVMILTKHQQRMAKMFQENQRMTTAANPETQALRDDIRELKALVHQQSIMVDSLTRLLPNDDSIRRRVG